MKPLALTSLALSLALPLSPLATPVPLEPAAAKEYAQTIGVADATPAALRKVYVQRDHEFMRRESAPLLMDVFTPDERPKNLPCVVVIKGGGFSAQKQERFAPFAAYLATKGFVAASISYRGRPDHTYRDTIRDIKAAVRHLRERAADFGIDPDRIGAMGQSAGGHLAAMLAVSDGVAAFEEEGTPSKVSCRIQAAVAFAGVFDFISRLKDGGQQKFSLVKKRQTNSEWIGKAFAEDSHAWIEASPITHLDAEDPPLLLVHCRSDRTVPVEQSLQMFHTAHELSSRNRLLIFEEGGGHGITAAKDVREQAWEATVAFFRETLKTE